MWSLRKIRSEFTFQGLLLIPLAFLASAALAGLIMLIEGPEDPPVSSGTPSATYKPVHWTYQGYECADGWPSDSIGRQGACSHHGGVVSVFEGDDGTVLRCGDDEHAPHPDEQQQQVEDYGRVVCVFR